MVAMVVRGVERRQEKVDGGGLWRREFKSFVRLNIEAIIPTEAVEMERKSSMVEEQSRGFMNGETDFRQPAVPELKSEAVRRQLRGYVQSIL